MGAEPERVGMCGKSTVLVSTAEDLGKSCLLGRGLPLNGSSSGCCRTVQPGSELVHQRLP